MRFLTIVSFFLFILGEYLSANSYIGGELRTRQTFKYGRFEVRMKPPAGEGVVASFFTFHEISNINEWNEIDIEILGRYDDDFQFTTITPSQVVHDSHIWSDFNPHLDFHTYAFEWTPDYVAWFVDGNEVFRQEGAHIASLNLPQKIMMNIWSPTYENWAGKWNPDILPVFAYYDWVSYASYTPGKGNVGTGNNFTFQWKDEFNSFDSNRWEKASHTFPGNRVKFDPQNVVFKDGLMILCLTDSQYPGYQDPFPPTVLWARYIYKGRVIIRFSEIIDYVSATNLSNYYMAGHVIQKAELLEDQRTVRLSVSGIDSTQQYYVAVLNIYDRASPPNKLIVQQVTIQMPKPLYFPVKIKVGSGDYSQYYSDQPWGASVEYGYLDGHVFYLPDNLDVKNTEADSIYINPREQLVEYKVRVPNGNYQMTLKFIEPTFTSPNQRVFDVVAEKVLVATNIDIFARAGINSAYDLTLPNIQVSDGTLDLHFSNRIGHSILSAIIIEQKPTPINKKPTNKIKSLNLLQNFPNPFNGETIIRYQLPEKALVELDIYNLQGQKVATLVREFQLPGWYQIRWQPDLPSGIYFYQLKETDKQNTQIQTRKMIIMK